nr:transposase [Iodidimonas gelatinilytica]
MLSPDWWRSSDYTAFEPLIEIAPSKPRMFLADKGYDSDHIRQSLLIHGILPVIPSKANRREPVPHNRAAYKHRNLIERMFNKLKQFRRIATRYEKTRASFLAFLSLADAKLWMPSFVNRA